MIQRKYIITARVAAHIDEPPKESVNGNFSFGALDAAKWYAAKHLPDYRVISCKYVKAEETETHGAYDLWKAEAVNGAHTYGCHFWIKSIC